jgi:hypothetical protein
MVESSRYLSWAEAELPMLSASCASLVGLWRGSPVADAGDEALRRAQMREPKCALNLPIAIGRTPVSQSQNPGQSGIGHPIAATLLSASPSLRPEAG